MNKSSATILGISIVIAFTILGLFFVKSRQAPQTVKVTGYATEEFKSNVVKWSVSFSERVSMSGIQEGYVTMSGKLENFKKQWAETGIEATDFKVFPVNVEREYGQGGQIGYSLSQRIYLISNQIEKVEQLAIDPQKFVKAGITFDNSSMEFYSDELDNIKKNLLGKATENARERAEQIVSATDLKVSKLISASAGVFQITEPYSTEVAAYGIYNTSSPDKNIKVTVSAEFLLK